MFSVVEFFRPDLWESFWRAWSCHRLFRFHGALLIIIAAVLVAAMPVPRMQWFIWIAIFFLSLVGVAILTNPERTAKSIIEFYLSRSENEIHQFTYMDAGLRVTISLCLIFSVIE